MGVTGLRKLIITSTLVLKGFGMAWGGIKGLRHGTLFYQTFQSRE